MMELPIGSIFCYPSPICPDVFLPYDGRELSKSAYRELYVLIGDTWVKQPQHSFCQVYESQSGDGMMSESELHLKTISIEYEIKNIQSNNTISFNEVLTPSEQKTELEGIDRVKLSFLGIFIGSLKILGSNKTTHRHVIHEIKVKDASNTTFQYV